MNIQYAANATTRPAIAHLFDFNARDLNADFGSKVAVLLRSVWSLCGLVEGLLEVGEWVTKP